MTNDDNRFRELIAQLATAAPPAPPLPSRSHRRRIRPIAAAAVCVAIVTIASGLFAENARRSTVAKLGEATPSTRDCPGQIDPVNPDAAAQRWLSHPNADGLPQQGTTTFSQTIASIAQDRASVEQTYDGVVSIGIGPGWGVTYSEDRPFHSVDHHAPDYEAVVTLDSRSHCPSGALSNHFLTTPDNRRGVPVLFRYRTTGASGHTLIYSAHVGGRPQLFALNLVTMKRRALGDGGSCGEDGVPIDYNHRKIAYCAGPTGRFHIFVMDFTTGKRLDIGPQYAHIPVAWTDDGNLLLLRYAKIDSSPSTPQSEILEVRNGRRVSLVKLQDENGVDVVGMADGVLAVMGFNMAKDSQSNLVLVKPNDSRTKTLYASARYAAPIAAFDGGRSLLTLAQVPGSFHGDFRLAVLRERDGVVTNQWTTMAAESFGNVQNRSALGSNGLIALSGSGPNEGTTSSIYVFDPSSSVLRRVTGGDGGPLTWTPDGSIVFRPDAGHLRLTDVDGHSRPLLRGKNLYPIAVF